MIKTMKLSVLNTKRIKQQKLWTAKRMNKLVMLYEKNKTDAQIAKSLSVGKLVFPEPTIASMISELRRAFKKGYKNVDDYAKSNRACRVGKEVIA